MRSLLIWTVPFILLAHYVAVFSHELTHSFVAWVMGYKSNPFNIQYGGTWNIESIVVVWCG
jgi:hypothetical protein